ncbi:MAG: oxygen-dependent coproporphyrinogen oxidase [Alphaproteobacteria bacterium]|nr:oxygen-dependent coproporphyrinogen oxidase [Alphaproteobacteria bacterium]
MTPQHQQKAEQWFRQIQKQIIAGLEALEAEYGDETAQFQLTRWQRQNKYHPSAPGAPGGGGTMAVLRGRVFEKAGVNFSAVHGHFSEKYRAEILGAGESGAFWASGVSLVIHPTSPFVPIIHMNTRMIATEKQWFGGGVDLTSCIPNTEDTARFHQQVKACCDRFDPDHYPKFKAWCDEYFFLPHRDEARGVGGIFYDYLDSGDWNQDFAFTQAIGALFLDLYRPLVQENAHRPWGEAEAEAQRLKRGRYVEFNLLFDRGTRFGLMTGGNTEAILMSLPPRTGWK